MDNHFTVTIHDDKGVKQFNVHKLIKKALLYATLFIFTLVIISIGTVLYLNTNINKIEKKHIEVEKEYKTLKQQHQKLTMQHQKLQSQMQITQQALRLKKKKLHELSDSLSEIETIIGLRPDQNSSLEQRVNITKLTFEQRETFFHFIPNGSPIAYNGITSPFGYRIHPTLHTKEFHKGSDMKAKLNTPVYAPADGIVEWAGYHKSSGFGYLVILQHIYGFKTYFGHLKKVVVKSGQFVRKGDLIAYTGNSGLSNGPHLHYEIRFLQRPLNPFYFIKWTHQNYDEIFKKEKNVPWQSLITALSQIKVVNQKQVQQPSLQQEPKSKAN